MSEAAATAVPSTESAPTELKPETPAVADPAPTVKDETKPEAPQENGNPAGPAPPSDADVISKLKEYLTDDSMTMDVTERQLRTRLEEHFGVPLKDRKGIIRFEVVTWLTERQREQGAQEEPAEEEEDAEVEAKPKKKRKAGGGLAKICFLSEPLQEFMGMEKAARTQVVKAMWDYIKANNLQNPSNKRKIILDDKLKTIFSPPLDMFSMNKQLSKHIFVDDNPNNNDEGDDDEPKPKKARKQPKKKAAKKADDSGDEEISSDDGEDDDYKPKKKRAGTSHFSRPLAVSEELSAWLGGDNQISRPELTKRAWAYFKEHDLLNPSDKREVICDKALRDLTGEVRFNAFSFAKYMKKHLLGPAKDNAEAAAPEAEEEAVKPEAEVNPEADINPDDDDVKMEAAPPISD